MIKTAYKYYNQNNYSNIPYPSPTLPRATVKSGGCGVCCASMIVENLTEYENGPKTMAQYAISKKARVTGGTDMNILARALRQDYGLHFTTTNNENILLDHLKKDGMAVVNVGGNRPGHIGVFSDGGHFIVVVGITEDGRLIVLDPGYYAGKFNKAGRVGKVKVIGNECHCDISALASDTANRSPAYWLFERKVEEVPDWMQKIMDDAKAMGLISGEHAPTDKAEKWFVLITLMNAIEILKGGK